MSIVHQESEAFRKASDALASEIAKLEAQFFELREYYGDGGTQDTERNIGADLAAERLLQVACGELKPPFTFTGEKINYPDASIEVL
jgi:hypothetical protein